jgi:hypothetical protein
MSGRPEKDARSHGEGYPDTTDVDAGTEEERYGMKTDAPKPDRRRRRKARPTQPPPNHERHGTSLRVAMKTSAGSTVPQHAHRCHPPLVVDPEREEDVARRPREGRHGDPGLRVPTPKDVRRGCRMALEDGRHSGAAHGHTWS